MHPTLVFTMSNARWFYSSLVEFKFGSPRLSEMVFSESLLDTNFFILLILGRHNFSPYVFTRTHTGWRSLDCHIFSLDLARINLTNMYKNEYFCTQCMIMVCLYCIWKMLKFPIGSKSLGKFCVKIFYGMLIIINHNKCNTNCKCDLQLSCMMN
jgi:hypothetical protein